MATYFGEVLPVISRAIEDEDDDDEIHAKDSTPWDVIIRWSPSVEAELQRDKHINCDLLIFAVKSDVCAFARERFLPEGDLPVGVISYGLDNKSRNTFSQTQHNDNSCFIHKIPNNDSNIFTVLWQASAHSEAMFLSINKLMQNFGTEGLKVIVLHTVNISEYQLNSDVDDSEEFPIKYLKTDANHENLSFQSLEAPNSVTGFPAHVLTYCQVHGISAVLYVSFQEFLDSSIYDEFMKIAISNKLQLYQNKNVISQTNSANKQISCYI